MTPKETGQMNNVMVICDRCNESRKGTIRIIKHKVYQRNIYYTSKLCKKCENELKEKKNEQLTE